MKKTSVLKPLKSDETVNLMIKIPAELGERIKTAKEKCKAKGFALDVHEAAISGITRLLAKAEKELETLK